MKTYVKCTGTEKLFGKELITIFTSKDATVIVTIKTKKETDFEAGHEYELMLTK